MRAVPEIADGGRHFASAWMRTTATVTVGTVLMILTAGIAAAQTPKQAPIPTEEQAQSAATGRPSEAELERWRKTILKTPRPKSGCFVASYPDKQWREVPCTTPPHKLLLPRSNGEIHTGTVGNEVDFSAQVADAISEAEGSFDSVSGVTSESSKNGANSYSLQLNTKPFPTTTCSTSPTPKTCQGWEQFVYNTSYPPSYGTGYIQYWLLDYGPAGTSCPSPIGADCQPGLVESDGWCPNLCYSGDTSGEVCCVVNSSNAAPVPAEPITSLSQLKVNAFTAGVTGPDDSITVSVGNSQVYLASGSNYFPDLGSEWQVAEFNVFGDGNSDQAAFNTGSTIVVRTSVDSGTTSVPAVPACSETGFTGETNNLTLVDTTEVPATSEFPSLVFTESNASGSIPADCEGTVSVPGVESILYSFIGVPNGENPQAGLIMDKEGNLYGTTEEGGSSYGTVFELTAASGYSTENVLYSFSGGDSGPDGAFPEAGLIMDTAGNLYGTTGGGGSSGYGTVFELTKASGYSAENVLHSFAGSPDDGAFPLYGSLIADKAGNLYGTTLDGGSSGDGTVFELTAASGYSTENVLHSFSGTTFPPDAPDGASPFAGLIMDASGNLYGTTYLGGSSPVGDGTVFELTAASGYSTENVLHSFSGTTSPPDGASPWAGLIMDTAGNLYGTTAGGGSSGYGTVFELTEASGYSTENVLYSFSGSISSSGDFSGPDGASPTAGLIMDPSGNLYGTTGQGGLGFGTAFELTAASGYSTENVLYSFRGGDSGPDGAFSDTGLIMDTAGDLYGTTPGGGSSGDGTVFELTLRAATPKPTATATPTPPPTPTKTATPTATPTPTEAAVLTISPGKLNFGKIDATASSTPKKLILQNKSKTTAAAIGQLSPPASFSILNDDCSNTTVEPNKRCTIEVAFAPATVIGSLNETLTIPYNGVSPSETLEGDGIPVTMTAPTSKTLPSASADSISKGTNIAISNRSTTTVQLGAASALADFDITADGCSDTSLAPKASCVVTVEFAPPADATGTLTGVLGYEFTYGANNGSVATTLRGTVK